MGGPPRSAWHSLGANGPLGGGGRDGGGDARTWDPLPRYARMYNPAIGHKARGLSESTAPHGLAGVPWIPGQLPRFTLTVSCADFNQKRSVRTACAVENKKQRHFLVCI